MLAVNIDSLKSIYSAFGTATREGTDTGAELLAVAGKVVESLEDSLLFVKNLQDQSLERVEECQARLICCQEKLQIARENLDEAHIRLRQAEAALAKCIHSAWDDEYGPPDCSGLEADMFMAQEYVHECEEQLHKLEPKVDQAQTALEGARRISDGVQEIVANVERRVTDGHELHDMLRRNHGNLTKSLNYRLPAIRKILGDKVAVIEGAYLARKYGGYDRIPSSHAAEYKRARNEFLQDVVYDYNIASHLRGEIQRDMNIKGRYYLRSPLGHDVGHRFRGINAPYNFRLESSDMNRWRGGKHKR